MKKIIVVLVAMLAMGCSTTSTITVRSGAKIDAHILAGDNENVYVKTYGGPQKISKKDIVD